MFCLIAVALLLLGIGRLRHLADDWKSQSALSALGQTLLLYANDHGGNLPDSWGTLMTAEALTPTVFVAPGGEESEASGRTPDELARSLNASDHCSFVYTAANSNQSALTAASVLAYQRMSTPANGSNVLLGDGSVLHISGSLLSRLIERLRARSSASTRPVELSLK